MEKRSFLIILTIIGVFLLITLSVGLKYSKAQIINNETFIKAQISQAAKDCVQADKCNKGQIMYKELLEKGFVQEDLLGKMNSYINTYVTYPDYNTILAK